MDIALITPVKNEEIYLPHMARAILEQTVLPKLWVIVDNESTDATSKIVHDLQIEYPFIKYSFQKSKKEGRNHLNFSRTVKNGYDFILNYCKENDVNFDYIAKVDADILLNKYFFERTSDHLKNNPDAGVVSSTSYTIDEKCTKRTYSHISKSELSLEKKMQGEIHDIRLYSKKCLDDIGGFPIAKYSPDTVMLVRLRERGWKMNCIDSTDFYIMRGDPSDIRAVLRSGFIHGRSRRYLNYNPMLMTLIVLNSTRSPPYLSGLTIILGYIAELCSSSHQIDDKSISDYFGHKRLREILQEKNV